MGIIGDDCVASFVYYILYDLNLCSFSLASLTYFHFDGCLSIKVKHLRCQTFVGLDIDIHTMRVQRRLKGIN